MNWEYANPTYPLWEQTLRETKQAYIDCWSDLPFAKAQKRRNLDFRAHAAETRDNAITIMREVLPHGYNAFHADLMFHLPESASITLAREGSVCIYVHAVLPDIPAMYADEHSVEDGVTRFWWD